MPAASNGQPDSYWIDRVRQILRDKPVWNSQTFAADGARGVLAAGSQPFRLQRAPVYQSDSPPDVIGPGGPYAVVYDVSPGASEAEIVTETGELLFAVAPGAGNLAVTYQSVKYPSEQILNALMEGLATLWPAIWSPMVDTTTILLSPVQVEYPLPVQFADPRTVMLEVELILPGAYIQGQRISQWRIINDVINPTLALARTPPGGAQLRITYTTMYGALASTPETVSHLPVYYALAKMLADQETMRVRDSDVPAIQGSSAAPVDASLNAARHWLTVFENNVARLGLGSPVRLSVVERSVERLGLSRFWRGAP